MKKILLTCLVISGCELSHGTSQYSECLKVGTAEQCEQFKIPKMQAKRVTPLEVISIGAGVVTGSAMSH